MANAFPFIYETLRQRSIDPSDQRFFLPRVLTGLSGSNSEGKLLPIERDSWQIGELKDEEARQLVVANITSQWGLYLEDTGVDLTTQTGIASPSNPYPRLELGAKDRPIIIEGLQNVIAHPAPEFQRTPTGYRAKIPLQFDGWDGTDGSPDYPRLSISAGYRLQLDVCTADTEQGSPKNVCNGNESTTVDGTGTVRLQIIDAWADAEMDIFVVSNQLVVRVTSLSLRGTDPGTSPRLQLSTDDITIDTEFLFAGVMWAVAVTNAITSPEGSESLFESMNATLNDESHLKSLSDALTGKLQDSFDDVLGTEFGSFTPPSDANNPADQNLFDRVAFALNTPSSGLFVPQLLCQSNNPRLNPLKLKQVTLPKFEAINVEFTGGKLLNVEVQGLPNLRVPAEQMQLEGDQMTFASLLGGWDPPPVVDCTPGVPAPPVVVKADFELNAPGVPPLLGMATITLQGSGTDAPTMWTQCRPLGTDASSLEVNLEAFEIRAAHPEKSVSVELEIQSAFRDMINEAINEPGILERIVDALNGEIRSQIPALDAELTTLVRTAIQNGLT